MEKLYFTEIENIKKKFIHLYMVTMGGVLILNIIIYQFLILDSALAVYLLSGLIFFGYTYILVKGKYSSDQILHSFMIAAPLYNFYIMLTFWNNSIGSIVTLFPLPLAAYIFFSKKEMVLYTIYLIMNVAACFFIHEYIGFQSVIYSHEEVIITDTILFGFNLIIIILLLIYNNKINKLKILSSIELQKVNNSINNLAKVAIPQKHVENKQIIDETAEALFRELENIMENKKIFKKTNLNISMLSTYINVNYTQLSKAIQYKGYHNFNNFLNIYRIEYVKKLINESDLQKVTLMYIYTESGFSNQATFNRVFKSIEGITPSEYIIKMNQKKSLM